MNNLGGVLK